MKVLEKNKKETESLKVTITYYILNEKKEIYSWILKGKQNIRLMATPIKLDCWRHLGKSI